MVCEVTTFSHVLDTRGTVRLPKHALYIRQRASKGRAARVLYVLDMRDTSKDSFRVYTYQNGTIGYYRSFPKKDSVGRMFVKYVLDTYGDKSQSIPGPIWPIYHRDNIGQPQDRRPQKFNAKHAHAPYVGVEARSVIDGCVIGSFRHTEESYHKIVLGI